ncbi:serine/threonine-protein kinase [Streptomyces mesophilus]|uniref:serine/threonine-protein kinase n=1 Tax=Streptomyces mesophilus TaxID=1775132 RepID=UPI00332E6473
MPVRGTLIAGRYRLEEPVGHGAMGRVWRAVDELLGRPVAVKEMYLDGPGDEDGGTRRERALREARASARIDHPHVVRVYDVAQSPSPEHDGRLWIVMELVRARSLAQVLEDEGPLGVRETARVGLALAEALRVVHAAGVLHRDIKPGNVLLEPGGGRVVLTDFGIAALQDAEGLTRAGVIVGSPEYLPPERVLGRAQGPHSDLWSLGATLCAALGGRPPFVRATTLATLHAVVYEEPELPPVPGELRSLLAALLAKDPGLRPDVDEVAAHLSVVRALPEPAPVQEPQPAPVQEPQPAPVRQPGPKQADWRPKLLTALVLLVAAAVATVMFLTARGEDDPGGDRPTTPAPTVAGTSRPPPTDRTTPSP